MAGEEINLLKMGDDFEKVHYHKVEKIFPNYELFWKKYIYAYREENDIQIREDVSQLTLIFRYSYSIFFNLMKANIFRENFEEEGYSFVNRYFDDFIIYLSASLELTEKLLLFLSIFENSFDDIGNISEDRIKDFAETLVQNIIDKIEEKISNEELFRDIEKNTLSFLVECNRNSISIGNLDNVNQLTTILEPFFLSKDKKLKKDFYRLKIEIATYRNLIVHEVKNYLYSDNGVLYIPRPDKLRVHNKTKLKISKEVLDSEFYNLRNLTKGQFAKSCFLLNRIWQLFLIDLFERNLKVKNFYESIIKTKKEIHKNSVYQTVSSINTIQYASDVSPIIIVGVSYSKNKNDEK